MFSCFDIIFTVTLTLINYYSPIMSELQTFQRLQAVSVWHSEDGFSVKYTFNDWRRLSSSCCRTDEEAVPGEVRSLEECNLICGGVERMFCQSATLLLGHVGPAVCVCLLLRLAERTQGAIRCLFGCRRCRAEPKLMDTHACTHFPAQRLTTPEHDHVRRWKRNLRSGSRKHSRLAAP